MNNDIGGIYYDVDARTQGMLDAARDVERSSRRMERSLDNIDSSADNASRSLGRMEPIAAAVRTAVVGSAAALTGFSVALLAVARGAAQSAKELTNQARLAGVSVEAFQQLAYAAKSVGVEQQKLGDIFKDAQDKIGDFIATGGGEMMDYFEKVAPLVGQTAEEFRNLSGPQVLIKLQRGLDAANLSMEQQVFYLESIADEASLLQPLLTNNAQGFKDMAKEARDLNAVLSQSEVERLNELSRGFGQLAQQISTETSRAILQFDDLLKSSLETTSEGLNALARGFSAFMDSFRNNEAKQSIAGIDAALNDVFDDKRRLEHSIELFGEDTWRGQQAAEALREVKAEYDELIERKKQLMSVDGGIAIPDTLNLDRVTPGGARLPGLGSAGAETAEKSAQDAYDPIKALLDMQREYNSLVERQRTASEQALATLKERLALIDEAEAKDVSPGAGGGYDEQRQRARDEALGGMGPDPLTGGVYDTQFGRYQQDEEAELERYAAQLERLRQAREMQAITNEQYNKREQQAAREHADQLAQIEQAKNSLLLSSSSETFGQMASLARGFAGEQSGIYRAMFAASKAFAIAEGALKIQGFILSAAHLPWPANLGAMASAAATGASIMSNIRSVSMAGGRRHGGYTSPGSIYPVAEGGKPEILTEGTKSYLIPGAKGKVTF